MIFSPYKISERFIINKLKSIQNVSLNLTNYDNQNYIFGNNNDGINADIQINNSKFYLDNKNYDNLPIGLFGDFYSHELSFTLINSNDYTKTNWQLPFVLAMGNEQQGLTHNILNACDQLIKLPMLGRSDSLNLAVSAGVALYESIRKNPN